MLLQLGTSQWFGSLAYGELIDGPTQPFQEKDLRSPSICFLALTAYPVLAGLRDSQELGGAQVQQAMLARALVKAGIDVSMICMDYGQPAYETIDGIRVIRSYAPTAGVRGLRTLHPRLTSVWRALSLANADVVYQRCAGVNTAIAVAWAKRHRRASIYAVASDLDLQEGVPIVPGARDKRVFTWGLRGADAVVLQNPRQQELLQEVHGRLGQLIPSCYAADGSRVAAAANDEVLWVGMLRPVKRPDRFLALARALPHRRFRMIGGPCGDSPETQQYFDAIARDAESIPNLEFMGFVPFRDVDPWFARAAVFVNTSEHEGFPNTFLQAWSRGLPTVALFDTGSRQNGQAPYRLVQTDAQLPQAVEQLLTDAAIWQQASDLCHAYFEAHHAPAGAASAYRQLMLRLVRGAS